MEEVAAELHSLPLALVHQDQRAFPERSGMQDVQTRSGGTQSVVVTHVNQHIAVGGNAVVAGQVKTGTKRGRRGASAGRVDQK
jgi:hypothetical protein